MSISRKEKPEKFRQIFEGFNEFSRNCKSWTSMEVFMCISELPGIDSYNCTYITPKELMVKLELTQPRISKAISELKRLGALKKIHKSYMVNPYLCFIGSIVDRDRAKLKWMKN